MAGTENDDLDIELDDLPEQGSGEDKTAGQPDAVDLKLESDTNLKVEDDSDEATAKEAAADLRRQLSEERAARREEERRRLDAEQQVERARTAVTDGQYGQIVNALEHRKTVLNQAQAALSNAVRDGDGNTAAKAQVAIANLVADIRDLEAGKRELEAGRPRTEGRVDPEPRRQETRQETRQEPQQDEDPVEAFLANIPDRSAKEWLRKHPECVTDRKLNSRMLAAHHEAAAEDIEIGSQSYYSHLEERLGFRKSKAPQRPELRPEPRAAPAAPASRDMASGGDRVTVRLSKAEQEAADMSGLSYKEYAQNKLALIRAGQLKA